jgi:hypothetical protein
MKFQLAEYALNFREYIQIISLMRNYANVNFNDTKFFKILIFVATQHDKFNSHDCK